MHATPFTITGTAAIESLNVAATVNICQYELHAVPGLNQGSGQSAPFQAHG